MKRLLRKIIKYHWLDLAVCAAIFIIFLLVNRFYYYQMFDIVPLITFVLIPLWFILRIAFSVFQLAEIKRREELAVTLLPAGKYIFSRLRLPVMMAWLPCLVVMQWMISELLRDADLFDTNFTLTDEAIVGLFFFANIALICAIGSCTTLAGLLNMLSRICVHPSYVYLYIPVVYYIVSIIAIIIAGFTSLPFIGTIGLIWPLYLMICLCIVLAISISAVVHNFKRAAAVYYVFE